MAWKTSLKEICEKYHDLICVAFFGVLIHLFPFFYSGRDPLGYDGGFYRRYVIDHIYFWQNVPGLGTEASLPKITFDFLKLIHLPTNIILYGSYIALYCGITIAIYFLVRYWSNARTAFFAILLFVISPVQYFGYWCMLYKNIYAFVLLVFTAYLIDKKSDWAYLGVLAIAFTHQTTSILFLLTLGIFFLINKENRRQTVLMFSLGGSLFLLLQSHSIVSNITNFPIASFLSWKQYMFFGLPVIILAVIGVKSFAKKMNRSFYFAFCIVAILYPLFHLPFFQRVLLYTDLALIVVASFGLAYLYEHHFFIQKKEQHYLGKIIGSFFIILASLFLTHKMITLFPIVTETDIIELEMIDSYIPPGSYILTNMTLAPWVEGFSHSHVISPGLLHDNHSNSEWQQYWSENSIAKKIEFLSSFPRPLYFFMPMEEHLIFVPSQCENKLSE